MNASPSYDLDSARSRIPILERVVPMNNCSQAPQTDATREAADSYLESWNRDGMDWDTWMGEVEGARGAFARLINAHPDEVAVATSASQAVDSLASALDFGRGRSTVVLTEAEFPTVAHVWGAQCRLGAKLRWVPVRDGSVDPDEAASAIDEDTAIASLTHGYYQTGSILDPTAAVEAARRKGALTFVDAYQSLGGLPVDVKALDVDALASGNMKFLMAIPGIAFLYVRREVAERLEPAVTGWFGRTDPFAFDARTVDWAPGARRFDTGTPPVVAAYVARAGMELLEDVGMEAVGAWNRILSQRLIEGGLERGLSLMSPTDPARKTPSTAFAVPDSHRIEALMMERGVIPSARGPAIRLAPHYYSTLEEVDRALDTLVDVLEQVRA